MLFQKDATSPEKETKTDHSILNVKDIIDFANTVDVEAVKEVLERQIRYNTAISEEGLRGNYGANIGKVLLHTYGDNIKIRARAKAAAVDAGIMGYEMYMQGQQFYGGDGIVTHGVENTIRNVGQLAKDGMCETDKEIIRIMVGKNEKQK